MRSLFRSRDVSFQAIRKHTNEYSQNTKQLQNMQHIADCEDAHKKWETETWTDKI